MRSTALLFLALLLPFAGLRAQAADFSKDEADLQRKASSALLRFAGTAERYKALPKAKQAYDLILDHYDVDNGQARRALGFNKVKDKWEQVAPDKRPKWEDRATYENRYKVVDEWYKTAVTLANLHRELGLKMVAGENLVRGTYHLERAVAFNPMDAEAHKGLGHKEVNGFWGTDPQVAFVARMKAIETKALELARKDYPLEALALDTMPAELKKMNLEFHGAKSENFKVWTRGTQENANNCVLWCERALDFLVYLVGDEQARRRAVKQNAKRWGWYGFVWTVAEREEFLKLNPQIYEGKTLEEAKAFANVAWKSDQGGAQVFMKLTPAQMHDTLIVQVFHWGLTQPLNNALGEGLHHAATWYLQSTSISQFGALPEGTVGAKELHLPESTNWWLRKMRDDAVAGEDWPLNQVPREQLSRFRNAVRIKSWSFMTWVLAAYPDQWLDFYARVPADKIPFPEEIDKAGEEAFGKPLAQVEAEWREWARGDSGVASATGYGPPLLPEKPNREELAVLEQMNKCRSLALAYTVTGKDLREGQFAALPPCELDAEASMACEDHAKYLTRWTEEHLKWPEAHEENPARDGFSPRGMRAGMRSVIVFLNANGGVGFAKDSVDGWIGTVYHRFPLLEHNINRFGYSYVYDNGWSVAVLDMGSLEEPYDPAEAPKFVAWPPPNMANVPLQFHGIEHPNPLDDQPESERDITRTGYPVSLQIQREFAGTLVASDINLYEVNTRAKPPEKYLAGPAELAEWQKRRKDPVSLWVHTPQVPLLKRMELREVVFGIPKEHLKPRTTYQVDVLLKTVANEFHFCWEFTTGTQKEGLKL